MRGLPLSGLNIKKVLNNYLIHNLNLCYGYKSLSKLKVGFAKALKMVKGEFVETVRYFNEVWLPARIIVQTAIEKRFEVGVLYRLKNPQISPQFCVIWLFPMYF